MNSQVSPWLAEIVIAGLDDWILSTNVLGVLSRSGVTDSEILRGLWIGVVAEGVCRGLIEPGEIVDDSFVAWNLPFSDSLHDIIERLDRVGIDKLGLGDVCWFQTTPQGDALAESLLEARTE